MGLTQHRLNFGKLRGPRPVITTAKPAPGPRTPRGRNRESRSVLSGQKAAETSQPCGVRNRRRPLSTELDFQIGAGAVEQQGRHETDAARRANWPNRLSKGHRETGNQAANRLACWDAKRSSEAQGSSVPCRSHSHPGKQDGRKASERRQRVCSWSTRARPAKANPASQSGVIFIPQLASHGVSCEHPLRPEPK